MKKIKLISTGGTIAMAKNDDGKLVPEFSGEELLKGVPKLDDLCMIEVHEFSKVDSSQMTPQMMFELAQLVKEEVNKSEIDGVVVTHGTDTLQETAYMLDLMVDTHKPVVITGAMRGATELGSDGRANIYQAFIVALEEKSQNQGVLVVLNNEIHTAKLLTKSHTTNLASFKSINGGRVGEVSKEEVNYFYNTIPSQTIDSKSINDNVAYIKMVAGIDPEIVDMMVNSNKFDGLVVEAFGSGTIPSNIASCLEKAIRSGIVVILTSRCLEGRLHNTYAASNEEKDLEKLGLVFSNGLGGPKVRIKLMLLLGGNYDKEEISHAF